MKPHALMALLVLSILVLIGCTGCDSDPNGSTGIDLTGDRNLLCNPEGWSAQEDTYLINDRFGTPHAVDRLKIEEQDNGLIACRLYDSNEFQLDIGNLEITEEHVVMTLQRSGRYTVRITASNEEANPDLSLTSLEDEPSLGKMYFSLGGDA